MRLIGTVGRQRDGGPVPLHPPPNSSLHAREPVLDDDGKLAALAKLIAHAITGLKRNPGASLRRTVGAALCNLYAVEHGVQISAAHDRSSWRWLHKFGARFLAPIGFLVLLPPAKDLSRRAKHAGRGTSPSTRDVLCRRHEQATARPTAAAAPR